MIPSRSDVFGFDGVEPGEGDDGNEGGETVLFSETFKAPEKPVKMIIKNGCQ